MDATSPGGESAAAPSGLSAAAEGAYYDTYAWGTEAPYQREVLLDLHALLPPEAATIADIGCGDGIITNRIAAGRLVVGIDTSVPALASVSRPKACGTILNLPFGDAAFDLVMANDVLEHMGRERREQASRELERIARDYIIVTVPVLENLAASQRLVDGVFRHANLHFESLDIARLRDSFRGFTLRACIFSGVTWEDELDDAERLKVLRAAVESDPALARRRDARLALVDAELLAARRRQAAFLCAHPDEIDGLLRRTEIICFFARNMLDWAPPPSLRDRAIDVGDPRAATVPVSLTALDFRTAGALRKASIPLYSPLPYWVCAGDARQDGAGTSFGAPAAGPVSVKLGFFAPLDDAAKLRLAGHAAAPGTLAVAHYDASGGYRQIRAQDIPAGSFDVEVVDFHPSVTQFGYLFDVRFTGGELTLRDVWVDHGDGGTPARLAYAGPAEYLHRIADDLHLFVSRRIDAVPLVDLTWFGDIETRRGSDGFRYYTEARDVHAALTRLELAHASPERARSGEQQDPDPAASQTEPARSSAAIADLATRLSHLETGMAALDADIAALRGTVEQGLGRLVTELDGLQHALSDGLAEAGRSLDARIATLEDGVGQRLRQQADEAAQGAVLLASTLASRINDFDSTLSGRIDKLDAGFGEIRPAVPRLEAGLSEVRQISRMHNDSLIYLDILTRAIRRSARVARPFRRALARRLDRRAEASPPPLPVATPPPLPAPSSDTAAAAPRDDTVATAPRLDGLPATVTMLVADNRIDRRVLHQARTLARCGARLTIVAAPYPGPVDMDQAEFPELAIHRIDTSRLLPPVPSAASRLRGDRDWQENYYYHHNFLAEALRHPAAAYVAHDLPVLPAAIAAADRIGAAVIYDAHELYAEQLVFGEARQQLYREVEAEVIGFADAVSTVNLSIAGEMARRYGVATPEVILNATDAGDGAVPAAPTGRLRAALEIPQDTRILLLQGGLSPNRNLENLVAAMADVTTPDLVLVVMGPGDEKRGELRLLAESLGIGPARLRFHEAVPQRVLLEYTASADAGIIPYPGIDINTTFCTPNKLFEFIAAGLPIVANDLPELRRFVADTGFGIVRPMNTAREIAAAIDALFARDLAAFRERLRAGASAFTWASQTDALLATYRAGMAARDRRMAEHNG